MKAKTDAYLRMPQNGSLSFGACHTRTYIHLATTHALENAKLATYYSVTFLKARRLRHGAAEIAWEKEVEENIQLARLHEKT